MQLSTVEKDDLLNGVRDAAVACQTALRAFRSDKSDAKREAVYAARKMYHDKLGDFLKEIEKGLDLDYDCLYTNVFAAVAHSAAAPDAVLGELDVVEEPDDYNTTPENPETDAG